jgi:signal transduction histidine kinase/CheY-like chemotaxis protein
LKTVVKTSDWNAPETSDLGMLISRPVALQALNMQAALLPYALGLFALALPFCVWACSFAPNRIWLLASFAIYAINWAAFYGAVAWLRRRPAERGLTLLRTRVQIIGGLLWSVAVAQLAIVGAGAGLASQDILLLSVGAAAICIFFSAPLLPGLLIVGPTAAATPIVLLLLNPRTNGMGRIALAAIALVMALSLILNRLLRQQFAMAAERELLIEDRARSLIKAEVLTKSKSDLLATLSHEIRNGLTGAAHVLAAAAGSGGRGAPSREQLTAALGATQDLLVVLDATLDMETAESGRLAIEIQPFDLPRLAQELVLLRRPTATAKGLELSVHIDDDIASGPGVAKGDPARVRQILDNLLGNAIKYTVRGRVELRVARLSDKRLRIEVVDTGPGLTAEEIEGAFQPFNRIKRTAAGVPGAGLGLALSRQLATLMNAEITAESAVGIGCCFRLDLPYDAGAQAETIEEPIPVQRSGPGLAKSLRILVAEDDALHAAMLRSVLEQLGHHVLQVQNGQRACELAQICELDLIMLDVRLPVLDGPQAIRALRQGDGPSATAPIIGIIGGDPEEATACLEAGANQVLRKPVTVAGVARALAGALRDERTAPALRKRA